MTYLKLMRMAKCIQGGEIKKEISSECFSENEDYVVEYRDNINAGQATILIKGIGRFSNELEYSFRIYPANLADASISWAERVKYEGRPVIPDITVSFGNSFLREGIDYSISCFGNAAPGAASFEVVGKGNFCGSRAGDFEIYEDGVSFTDVDDSTPHAEDIWWLADNGISTGWVQSDGTAVFRGMDTVKRQDMAAFLYRLAGSPEYSEPSASPFIDVDESTPHYKEICWLADKGISTGWIQPDGSAIFCGMDTVKRQDMAAFLKRLSDSVGKGQWGSQSCVFSDVDPSTPHFDEILWLASNGVTTGWSQPDGTSVFCGMDTVKRQDMAAFLHRMSEKGLV